MAFHSTKTGQFAYFDTQLGRPDWSGRRVLDFGGNIGTFLEGAAGRVEPSLYWCVDVSRPAIEEGRRREPEAHWVFYDRYNPQFNPGGLRGLALPDLETRFDYVLAYSVFTHTPDDETVELVDALRSTLTDDGMLAFTFIAPGWVPPGEGQQPNVRWRLSSRSLGNAAVPPSVPAHMDAVVERAREAPWCAVVDQSLLFDARAPVGPCGRYDVLWSPDHARSLFPFAEVRPPAAPERQHCCLIGPED
ncbi:class I SAM-dependent methyltransferase [Streptomyces sp. DSM 40750]|uniref:class I SAM-dependent methyltransferase n=1 Tax=Streptomyces sp. DSM 40750 TaxID=2801030 RepID=UPI00214B02A3|nr:class I SAM-dependent methyltransferase [Streptomyces sp. DSM 40750]UUU25817.1 class I SAM-dependent methyltransferase [Streptomyces sp. DSM 40750]